MSVRDDVEDVGIATACLDALLVHEAAESRMRFLFVEGATDAEMAEASNAAAAAFEAYRAASSRWHAIAITPKRQPEYPRGPE